MQIYAALNLISRSLTPHVNFFGCGDDLHNLSSMLVVHLTGFYGVAFKCIYVFAAVLVICVWPLSLKKLYYRGICCFVTFPAFYEKYSDRMTK